MFGRVRPPSSPPEDLERPPSKILKDDSLSIYEVTLMKLKLGSRRELRSSSEEATEIETDSTASVSKGSRDALRPSVEAMEMNTNDVSASAGVSKGQHVILSYHESSMDTDCSSAILNPSSSDCQSICSPEQQESRNLSVPFLFSKYKTSQRPLGSSYSEAMAIESDSSAASTLSSCSECNL